MQPREIIRSEEILNLPAYINKINEIIHSEEKNLRQTNELIESLIIIQNNLQPDLDTNNNNANQTINRDLTDGLQKIINILNKFPKMNIYAGTFNKIEANNFEEYITKHLFMLFDKSLGKVAYFYQAILNNAAQLFTNIHEFKQLCETYSGQINSAYQQFKSTPQPHQSHLINTIDLFGEIDKFLSSRLSHITAHWLNSNISHFEGLVRTMEKANVEKNLIDIVANILTDLKDYTDQINQKIKEQEEKTTKRYSGSGIITTDFFKKQPVSATRMVYLPLIFTYPILREINTYFNPRAEFPITNEKWKNIIKKIKYNLIAAYFNSSSLEEVLSCIEELREKYHNKKNPPIIREFLANLNHLIDDFYTNLDHYHNAIPNLYYEDRKYRGIITAVQQQEIPASTYVTFEDIIKYQRYIQEEVINALLSICDKYEEKVSSRFGASNQMKLDFFEKIITALNNHHQQLKNDKLLSPLDFLASIIQLLHDEIQICGTLPKIFTQGEFGEMINSIISYLKNITVESSIFKKILTTHLNHRHDPKIIIEHYEPFLYKLSTNRNKSDFSITTLITNIQRAIDVICQTPLGEASLEYIRDTAGISTNLPATRWGSQMTKLNREVTAIYFDYINEVAKIEASHPEEFTEEDQHRKTALENETKDKIFNLLDEAIVHIKKKARKHSFEEEILRYISDHYKTKGSAHTEIPLIKNLINIWMDPSNVEYIIKHTIQWESEPFIHYYEPTFKFFQPKISPFAGNTAIGILRELNKLYQHYDPKDLPQLLPTIATVIESKLTTGTGLRSAAQIDKKLMDAVHKANEMFNGKRIFMP